MTTGLRIDITALNPEYMNAKLSYIPKRTEKPRESGLNMVMDKGLSLRQTEDFIELDAGRTDLLKLGFGTSLITPNLKEKVKLYLDAGIGVYCGGTFVSYSHLRAHETVLDLVCRSLLEKKKHLHTHTTFLYLILFLTLSTIQL